MTGALRPQKSATRISQWTDNFKRFILLLVLLITSAIALTQFIPVPIDGFEMAISAQSAAPLQILATDYSNGLPDLPGIPPRPADTMPAPYDFADPTIVTRSLTV
jgi:hypothetical protein